MNTKYNVDRKNTKCLKWDLMQFIGGSADDIPMWIADMDYEIEPSVIAAIRKRLEHPVLGYTFQPPCYKEAISHWYAEQHGTSFAADAVVPCLNVLGSMQLIMNQVITAGDKVMMFTPIYPQFYGIIKTSGAELTEYPLYGCEEIDWEKAEELISSSKVMIFCNPHNPLARCWTRQECEKVAEICAKYHVLLLSDEVHGDMAMFGSKYYCMASFETIQENVIIFTSAAKTFNLAGLGGAALIIPGQELREKTHQLLEQYYQCEINALSAEGIQAAYENGADWLADTRNYLEENVKMVLEFLKENMPEIKCEHQASFLMWMDFRGLNRPDLDIADLCKKEAHILLDNGSRYGAAGAGFIRANIACSKELLQKALDGLFHLYKDIKNGKY